MKGNSMKSFMLSLVVLSVFALGCTQKEYDESVFNSVIPRPKDSNMYNEKDNNNTKCVFTKHTKEVILGINAIKSIEEYKPGVGWNHWPYAKSVITMIDDTPYHTDETLEEIRQKISGGIVTIHYSWETQEWETVTTTYSPK